MMHRTSYQKIWWLVLIAFAASSVIVTLIVPREPDDSNAMLDSLKTKLLKKFPSVPTITVEQLRERVASPGTGQILIDARTSAEFEVSHIEGAIHIEPNQEAPAVISSMFESNSDIVIYCSVGYRSAVLAKSLKEIGFVRTSSLIGGIFEWANRGLAIVSSTGPAYSVHPFNSQWGKYLTPSLHPTSKKV